MNNYKEVREAIALLAQEFGIPVPPVVESRGKVSLAWFGPGNNGPHPVQKLYISTNDWHGLEFATIHEFTHAVRCFRVGPHNHDYEFFKVLSEVVRVWKGDVKAYDWHNEYQTIWSYAARAGYTDKPHWKQARRMKTVDTWYDTRTRSVANSSGILVVPGMHVKWTSRKFGNQVGVVVSARAGCRAKVKTERGLFYVPQSWLKKVGE